MKKEIELCVDVNLEDFVSELCYHLTREDLIGFIDKIINEVQDFDFLEDFSTHVSERMKESQPS